MGKARLLHVTDGDEAAGRLAAAGVEGEVLPWRDARLEAGRGVRLHGAHGPRPASPADGASRFRTLAATEPGRAVLAGELDAARARGLDRWLGGVYLSGRHPP